MEVRPLAGHETAEKITPFLAQFATPRTGSDALNGHYCPLRHVWVITDPSNEKVPLASLPGSAAMDITVTKVLGEQTDRHDPMLHAGTTVTSVKMEADDIRGDLTALLLSATITEVQSEQADK